MKKLLLITTSVFIVSAMPAIAADATATTESAPATTTEAAPADAAPKMPEGAKAPAQKKDGEFRKGMGMFESADLNGDKVVTKDEFLANSEKYFATLDTSGDGKITKEEIDAKKEEWRKKMKEMRAQREAQKEKQGAEPEKKAE